MVLNAQTYKRVDVNSSMRLLFTFNWGKGGEGEEGEGVHQTDQLVKCIKHYILQCHALFQSTHKGK